MPNGRPLRGWYRLRWQILKRDNFTCQYCGQYAPNVRLEVDHRLAIVDGGTDAEENLVTACYACNRGKEGLRAHIAIAAQPVRSEPLRVVPVQLPARLVDSLTTRIRVLLSESPEMTPKQIAAVLDCKTETARRLRRRIAHG